MREEPCSSMNYGKKSAARPFDKEYGFFTPKTTGKYATWNDLQKSFETASGVDLQTFFTERLTRRYIPESGYRGFRTRSCQRTTTWHSPLTCSSNLKNLFLSQYRSGLKRMTSTINVNCQDNGA